MQISEGCEWLQLNFYLITVEGTFVIIFGMISSRINFIFAVFNTNWVRIDRKRVVKKIIRFHRIVVKVKQFESLNTFYFVFRIWKITHSPPGWNFILKIIAPNPKSIHLQSSIYLRKEKNSRSEMFADILGKYNKYSTSSID